MGWTGVALVPSTGGGGTGVELLYFSVVSTLLGMAIASLTSKLLRKTPPAGEEQRGRRSLWILYVLVVLPAMAFLAYHGVHVNDRNDVLFLAGFLLFSAGGGVLIGQVRSRGHDQW